MREQTISRNHAVRRGRRLCAWFSDSTLTKSIKKRFIDFMEEKYTNSKTKEILNIATFVDPRFKIDFLRGLT